MLSDSVDKIAGIGPKNKKTLYDASIRTKEDLLLFTPSRYIHYEEINPNEIVEDMTVTLRGVVDSSLASLKFKATAGIIFYIICNNIRIKVIGFGMEYLRYKLKKGCEYAFFGSYKCQSRELYIKNVFDKDFRDYIEPVYPVKIPNSYMMKFVSEVYKERPSFTDDIPEELLKKNDLLDINSYLFKAHFPSSMEDTKEVLRRSKYESYLKYNVRLKTLRYYYESSKKEPKKINYNEILNLIKELPYKLTDGQMKAIDDIFMDFKSTHIANRLIQGDVGSGKTIVAIIAMYTNYLSGYQGALMVPSEVLSSQHFENIKKLLDRFGVRIALLNSSVKAAEKKRIYSDLSDGNIDIVIGTQSLIQDGLMFKNLGLVVIDEQHRFGVRERQNLLSKGIKCDSLFMSATPIPRTLGITRFADLDITTIESMPANRKDVMTRVCDINDTEYIAKAIYKNVSKGHQVFVVVPVINESVLEGIVNVDEAHERLKSYLPNVRFAILHGSMKSAEKNQVMQDFKNHLYDCLISTTVIEVGIDIRNATLMVIYNAERYGLATLHQLRGRVGRNDLISGCLLATAKKDCERLKIMEETYDCFKLAEEDLALRGPGDILGSSQSGFTGMNILNDLDIFNLAKKDAEYLYDEYTSGKMIYIVDRIVKENDENNKLN